MAADVGAGGTALEDTVLQLTFESNAKLFPARPRPRERLRLRLRWFCGLASVRSVARDEALVGWERRHIWTILNICGGETSQTTSDVLIDRLMKIKSRIGAYRLIAVMHRLAMPEMNWHTHKCRKSTDL